MSRRRALVVLCALAAGAAAGAEPASGLAATSASADGYVQTTTSYGGRSFAPAFVGNGYLATRVPAAGTGYGTVPLPEGDPLQTQSQVQGLYGINRDDPTSEDEPLGPIERRAALPAWTSLEVAVGGERFRLGSSRTARYRQALDERTGTLTTSVDWRPRAGGTLRLRFAVTPDRAREHAALVTLRIVADRPTTARVTDLLDGRASDLVAATRRGRAGDVQFTDLRTRRLGVRATVASALEVTGATASARGVAVRHADRTGVAQAATLRLPARRAVSLTKVVGIATSEDAGERGDPHARALAAVRRERGLGAARARRSSDAAWARLWRSAIDVDGDARLQQEVRSAQFALLASLRADQPWAPSPGGLSSDGYNGHVFWDSETWMYPAMLATAPDLAREMLRYRTDRLGAARARARAGGKDGARFPWESGLSGREETPSCCDTGKYELHVNADISLAFWQRWLASGDRAWLRREAWPVVSGIASYWATRATRDADGTWSIRRVIPPDEYRERGIDDSVYTNVAVRDALRIAGQVAGLTGHAADPRWAQVADGLRIAFDPARGIHPEYPTYDGRVIKQADVTLLSYPWENPQGADVTQRDLDFYLVRTDSTGPSMTDAIHSIVSSKLGTPGCSAFALTQRSVEPFMRGPYAQFSEAREGGAFTFTTGAGGFLQELLYGYSGMRWRADALELDPSLPPQLRGVTLRGVHWRGRVVRVRIARGATRLTLLSGAALPVRTPAGTSTLRTGAPLTIATRRPDEAPTDDLARCAPSTATPAAPEPALAANDGSAATTWQATTRGARVVVDLGAAQALRAVRLTRPARLVLPQVAEHPDSDHGGVVDDLRGARALVDVSADGTTWRTLGVVPGAQAEATFGPGSAPVRYLRVRAASDVRTKRPVIVGELQALR